MRAVLDHLPPRQGEERGRPGLRRDVERGERLRVALEERLGAAGRLLDVDPRAGHAHQHVGPRAGAHLAAPARIIGRERRRPRHVLGERADPHVRRSVHLVEPAHQRGQLRDGRGVIGAVHGEHGVVAEPGPRPVHEARRRRLELIRNGEHARRIAVAGRQVLGAHPGAVGALPAERVAVDRGRHAAPYDGVGEAGPAQDLWHLRDVAEHVGEVADVHRLTEVVRAGPSHLEVADERLAADQELVHQDLPGADGEPSAGNVARQAVGLLGPDLEVVIDRRQLAVEGECEVGLRLQHLEDAVDEVDQLHPEALEGAVPLTIPMRVRYEVDGRLAGSRVRWHMSGAYRVRPGRRVRRMTYAAAHCRFDLGHHRVVVAQLAGLAEHPTAIDRLRRAPGPGRCACRLSVEMRAASSLATANPSVQPARGASSGASMAAFRSPSRSAGERSPNAAAVASAWSRRSPEPTWLKWAEPTVRPVDLAQQEAARLADGARRIGVAEARFRQAGAGRLDERLDPRPSAGASAREVRNGTRESSAFPKQPTPRSVAVLDHLERPHGGEADLHAELARRGHRRCRPGRRPATGAPPPGARSGRHPSRR